jgi:hypothetical protein
VRVTPWIVRSPWTTPSRPRQLTPVLRKTASGKVPTSKSSGERRCSSRVGLPDSTLAMPMVTSTRESAMFSAMVTAPRTSVNRPRTLVTMR